MEQINWYPGHMKKTRELIASHLKLVDTVVELLDARIPAASQNPLIGQLVGTKEKVILLNKCDLADPAVTRLWQQALQSQSPYVLATDAARGKGMADLLRCLGEIRRNREGSSGRKRGLRLMILGIPNVGKSSLINRLAGRKGAATGNRPGVTRGKQWLKVGEGIQLLDTPGILWPKFEDPKTGLHLAFCGSIRDETLDLPTLALSLVSRIAEDYPQALQDRYGLEVEERSPLETLDAIAAARGCILSGGRLDYERAARLVLGDFRSGKLGAISLERPS